MKKHIYRAVHKLRQQPEEVRRHILHIIIFACAIILALLWVLSLGRTLGNKDVEVSVNKDLKPFTVLKDNLTSGYKGVSIEPNNQ
jgi:hypothetical protein